jgi:hypothetical protein
MSNQIPFRTEALSLSALVTLLVVGCTPNFYPRVERPDRDLDFSNYSPTRAICNEAAGLNDQAQAGGGLRIYAVAISQISRNGDLAARYALDSSGTLTFVSEGLNFGDDSLGPNEHFLSANAVVGMHGTLTPAELKIAADLAASLPPSDANVPVDRLLIIKAGVDGRSILRGYNRDTPPPAALKLWILFRCHAGVRTDEGDGDGVAIRCPSF